MAKFVVWVDKYSYGVELTDHGEGRTRGNSQGLCPSLNCIKMAKCLVYMPEQLLYQSLSSSSLGRQAMLPILYGSSIQKLRQSCPITMTYDPYLVILLLVMSRMGGMPLAIRSRRSSWFKFCLIYSVKTSCRSGRSYQDRTLWAAPTTASGEENLFWSKSPSSINMVYLYLTASVGNWQQLKIPSRQLWPEEQLQNWQTSGTVSNLTQSPERSFRRVQRGVVTSSAYRNSGGRLLRIW